MVCLKAYQSNRIEWLADRLVENLYDRSDPFDIPTIVVPNQSVKEFLRNRWAKEVGITMGIRFQFLEEAIIEQAGIKGPFPSRMEVSLKIGKVLEREPFGSISEYIKESESRIVSLSYALSEPLMQWAIYGGELPKWVESVGKSVYRDWGIPRKKLEGKALLNPLHLFGFSHLPPIYFDFFSKGPASLYLFSPCAHFWTDIFTEKGAAALGIDQEVNPLLADWGRVTREMLKRVEEVEAEVIEHYPLLEEVASDARYQDFLGGELTFEKGGALSSLRALQADLILLRDKAREGPIDETISVHAAPSRFREIEVCAEEILKSYERGSTPSDWVVMAPDMTPYVPYIEAVFEREGLPYQIQGITAPSEDSLEGGLTQLLALIGSRFEASRLLKWIRHPLVMEKAELSKADIIHFERWVEAGGIRWGKNRDHWESIFSAHYGGEIKGEGSASWEAGFSRLFHALAQGGLGIELSQAEALGKLCALFEALKKRTLEIEKAYLPLSGWAALLNEVSRYFFGKASLFPSLGFSWKGLEEEIFSFPRLRPHLEREWGSVLSTRNAHRLEGALFRPFLPMQARPSPHLFLLGMDEEAFPRKKRKSSFALIHPALPTLGSLDRALLLEACHGAKKTMAISYTHTSSDDGASVNPSPLIQDLMSYVGIEPIFHPHAGYLESVTYSESQYRRGLSLMAPFSPLEPAALPQPVCAFTIDVHDLRLSASDPFRLHSRQLGIDRTKRIFEVEDTESFVWDPIEIALRTWSYAGHKGPSNPSPIPEGPFGQLIAEKVAREGKRLHKELEEITSEKLKVLQLGGEAPPLEVALEGGAIARIIGEIGPFSSEGLIVFSKGAKGGAFIRSYPLFLVFAALIARDSLAISPSIHFIRDGVSYSAPKEPLVCLKHYLTYYLRCLREPAPFDGEGIIAFLKGKAKMKGWKEVELAFSPIIKEWKR